MQMTGQTEDPSRVLRPLGAFEQVFHLYIQHNPTHFCIPIRVAGPANQVGVEQLAAASRGCKPCIRSSPPPSSTGRSETDRRTRRCFTDRLRRHR